MRLGLYWHRLQPLSPQPELLQDSNKIVQHAVRHAHSGRVQDL
jgi:hypothetical protein